MGAGMLQGEVKYFYIFCIHGDFSGSLPAGGLRLKPLEGVKTETAAFIKRAVTS
jgi:hypothetical protein